MGELVSFFACDLKKEAISFDKKDHYTVADIILNDGYEIFLFTKFTLKKDFSHIPH